MAEIIQDKKHSKNQIDMLNGGITGKIFLFALPLAASSILQQLFNAVDLAVVGRWADANAQAAVGGNAPLINLLVNLFIGISIGANVVISNHIGADKKENVSDAVHTSMLVAIISGFLLLVVGILVSRPVLTLMDTPAEVLDQAVLYMRIIFLGMPVMMVYNFGASILRSIGDTRRPLICLIISGLINAGLNMFLVIVFHLDVAGVAIATVVANIISATMVVIFLIKETSDVKLDLKKLKIHKEELKRILSIGVPAGIQGMVFSISNVFIQTFINSYGADAMSGSAVALNYEYMIFFIVSAFTQAAVTFVSQNYGAGKYDRVKKIFRTTLIWSVVISQSAVFLCYIFAEPLSALFNSDPGVITYSVMRIRYVLILYFLICIYEITGGVLRGMGYSLTPAVLTVFGTCVLRLIWIFTVCTKYHDFKLILFIYPISWGITAILVVAAYLIIRKKAFSRQGL